MLETEEAVKRKAIHWERNACKTANLTAAASFTSASDLQVDSAGTVDPSVNKIKSHFKLFAVTYMPIFL